jgi:hypothetical protein
MKKKRESSKKLTLKKSTVVELNSVQLEKIKGGSGTYHLTCPPKN